MAVPLQRVVLVPLVALLCACHPILREKPKASESRSPLAAPQSEAEAQQVLNEAGKDVVYGETLGEIGASILIPPYGIYKLGQAAASAAGYELDVTKALPKEDEEAVKQAGEAIISAPGKAAAWAADEEYRGKGKILGK